MCGIAIYAATWAIAKFCYDHYCDNYVPPADGSDLGMGCLGAALVFITIMLLGALPGAIFSFVGAMFCAASVQDRLNVLAVIGGLIGAIPAAIVALCWLIAIILLLRVFG